MCEGCCTRARSANCLATPRNDARIPAENNTVRGGGVNWLFNQKGSLKCVFGLFKGHVYLDALINLVRKACPCVE